MEKPSSSKKVQEPRSQSKGSKKVSVGRKTLDPQTNGQDHHVEDKKTRGHASELLSKPTNDDCSIIAQKDELVSMEKHRTTKSIEPSDQATEGKFVSPSIIDEKRQKKGYKENKTIVDGKSWVISQKSVENSLLGEAVEKEENLQSNGVSTRSKMKKKEDPENQNTNEKDQKEMPKENNEKSKKKSVKKTASKSSKKEESSKSKSKSKPKSKVLSSKKIDNEKGKSKKKDNVDSKSLKKPDLIEAAVDDQASVEKKPKSMKKSRKKSTMKSKAKKSSEIDNS